MFENAFDKLFSIINAEGGLEGGIVVTDSLQLIYTLLFGNSSNQNHFRETGCFSKLASLFPNPKTQQEWPVQKITGASVLLDIIRIFVSPKTSATALQTNQNMLRKPLLDAVIELGLGDYIPPKVKQEALRTVADLIRGNEASQDVFAKSMAKTCEVFFSPLVTLFSLSSLFFFAVDNLMASTFPKVL